MRTREEISADFGYLASDADATTKSFAELDTELLLDIRELLVILVSRDTYDEYDDDWKLEDEELEDESF